MLYLFFITLLLSACATTCATPEQIAQWRAESAGGVTCTQGIDCEVKWGRALQWVQNNSGWNIQIANDSLITTAGPFDTPYPAYSIIKLAKGNGTYNINWQGVCNNFYSCCKPDINQSAASFVKFVRMVQTTPPPSILPQDATTDKMKFGVTMVKTDQTTANLLGMNEPRGVVVVSVVNDSVAFRSGIKQSDAILQYGVKTINEPSDVQSAVADTYPGSSIPVIIWRAGQGELVIAVHY